MKFAGKLMVSCLFVLVFIASVQPKILLALECVVTKTDVDDGSYGTLRWAVGQANAGSCDRITFSSALGVATVNLSSALTVSSSHHLTIEGNGVSQTIIDGYQGGVYHGCFYVSSGSVTFKNLTIRNGRYGAAADYQRGGGLFISGYAFAQLYQCRITDCQASTHGGAIYVSSGGSLEVISCELSGNQAGEKGGAVYNNHGDVLIQDSEFLHNAVAGTSLVEDGYGHAGGAVYSYFGSASKNPPKLTITTSTFTENYSRIANDGYGGAICSLSTAGCEVDISYSTFTGNLALKGGALVGFGGWINVSKSTFSGNQATIAHLSAATGAELADGGAVWFAGGNLNFWNSTVSANLADNSGGGIFDGSSSASVSLSYVTIYQNRADADYDGGGVGGGIYQASAVISCINTLVAGNLDESPGLNLNLHDFWGTLSSLGHNLIGKFQEGTFASIEGDESGNLYGSGSEPLDPKLGALGKGVSDLTETHPLLVDSPAIDAGCEQDVFGNAVMEDQRDFSRPIEGDGVAPANSDIGAYELIEAQCLNDRVAAYAASDEETVLFGESSLQAAVDAIASYQTGSYLFKCREGWSGNSIFVDTGADYELVFSGGYSCDRSEKIGISSINHSGDSTSLTIASGTVFIEDFVLQ